MSHSTVLRRAATALCLMLVFLPAAQADPGSGWLHTDGALTRDVDGNQVLLAGAQNVGEVTPALTARMRQAGLNSVRQGVIWEELEPTRPTLNGDGSLTHHWDARELATLDRRIRALTDAHVRVILEFHQSKWSSALDPRNRARGFPGWLYPGARQVVGDQMKARQAFFKDVSWPGFGLGAWKPQELAVEMLSMLARRYADNSWVVGFDLINEPTWGQGNGTRLPKPIDLTTYYRKAAHALQAISPRLLMIWQPGTFSQEMYERGTTIGPHDEPLDVPNAVMSIHFYPKPPVTSRQLGVLQKMVDMAGAWHQPFWIGEFNAYEQGRDKPPGRQVFGAQWKPLTQTMMRFTRANNVGWSFFALQRGVGASLTEPTGNGFKADIVDVLRLGQIT